LDHQGEFLNAIERSTFASGNPPICAKIMVRMSWCWNR